jgi:hypothetical protein
MGGAAVKLFSKIVGQAFQACEFELLLWGSTDGLIRQNG